VQNYLVFLDELSDSSRSNSAPTYQISLSPSTRNASAMGTKNYPTREAFIAALQHYFKYTDVAIERFFSTTDRHQTLTHQQLSDEDAASLGWLPEYNRN